MKKEEYIQGLLTRLVNAGLCEHVVVLELEDALESLEIDIARYESREELHTYEREDLTYDKKLRKALKLVIAYFSVAV